MPMELAMNRSSLHERMKIEQEKLRKLGEEALKYNIPLTRNEAFMAQNRKVDALVVKMIKGEEGHKKKQ